MINKIKVTLQLEFCNAKLLLSLSLSLWSWFTLPVTVVEKKYSIDDKDKTEFSDNVQDYYYP